MEITVKMIAGVVLLILVTELQCGIIRDTEDSTKAVVQEKQDVFDQILQANKGHEEDFFEGDIKINTAKERTRRGSTIHRSLLWANRIIPYEFDTLLSEEAKSVIISAINAFETNTCIKFVPYTSEAHHVAFIKGAGCFSFIGKVVINGANSQDISIGSGCDSQGIVEHEIMHCLGFYHEQSRPDRDNHVAINWENINTGFENNFIKQTTSTVEPFKTYDYESVMHYTATSFSRNGLPTISVFDPSITIGQRVGMSQLDIDGINALYDCSNTQTEAWSNWSEFQPCRSCKTIRTRFCISADSNTCLGNNSEEQDCPCNTAVNGAWTAWTSWGSCSADCDTGVETRTRTCTEPAPANSGASCTGDASGSRRCRLKSCIIGSFDTQFETGFEPWTNLATTDSYDYILGKSTSTSDTGPQNGDHSSGKGQFAYLAGQLVITPGYAALESPSLTTSSTPIHVCIHLWYYMYGNHIGKLSIAALDTVALTESTVFEKIGNQGDWWTYAEVTVLATSTMKYEIRAHSGSGQTSDIAIDDITVTNSACSDSPVDGGWSSWGEWGACSLTCDTGSRVRSRLCNNPLPIGTGKACPGSSNDAKNCRTSSCIPAADDCTFEKSDFCLWTNPTRDQRNFVLGSLTPSSATGPQDGDHTTGTNGIFAYFETSSPVTIGNVALLESRQLGSSSSGFRCFYIWYHMYGNSIGSLQISSRNMDTLVDTQHFYLAGDQGNVWNYLEIELNAIGNSKIIINATAGNSFTGDIAIDDLMLTEESCTIAVADWGQWSSYSSCSKSCGTGSQSRSRSCQNQGTCVGSSLETKSCATSPCVSWSAWENWSSCSLSCNNGIQSRSRICNNGESGSPGCEGSSTSSQICNDFVCPTWTDWANWSSCSATCGGGSRFHSRSCQHGVPGQDGCTGVTSESEACNTRNCPSWTGWTPWSICSVSCGGGARSRLRRCNDGSVGQDGCIGEENQTNECNTPVCPSWSLWSLWTICSASCGSGARSRSRNCENGNVGQIGCIGDTTLTSTCNEDVCPSWASWSGWTGCTVTCGGGIQSRSRNCQNGVAGQPGCPGEDNATTQCATAACPKWLDWSLWNDCSVSCGGGSRTRSRNCENGSVGQTGCLGSTQESSSCNSGSCPVLSSWSNWSNCPVTCGGGIQNRTRSCQNGVVGDVGCIGSLEEAVSCNTGSCVSWTGWGSWQTCSEPCGGGSQSRSRTCQNGEPGDAHCPGSASQTQACNKFNCVGWSPWSDWSTCDVTCGGGSQTSSRTCLNGNAGDPGCIGTVTRSQECNVPACPSFSTWSLWSTCSKSCATGSRVRTRTCQNGPGCIGAASMNENCNTNMCPIFTTWVAWSSCSQSCGTGSRSRTRTCQNGVVGNPGCQGLVNEQQICNTNSCPLFLAWSQWSTCSKTCATGSRVRTRTCQNGPGCIGAASMNENCNTNMCPIFTTWVAWSSCSQSCGTGSRSRTRTCQNGVVGNPGCQGLVNEQQICNTNSCPLFLAWSQWSTCSKSCGTGARSRTRSCQNGVVGNPGCEGSSNEAQNCNTNNCASFTAWSSWLSCSKTCGTGTRSRTRSCQHGVVGDPGCEGSSNEAQNCNTNNCASFTAWSSWLSCSKTCGTGTRSRTRSCQHGVVGDPGCEGSSNEAQNCNTNNCASFTAWSSWLSCSKTCGTGTRSRTRSCQNGVVGDPGCEGSSIEAQNCNTNNCASFTAWSSWLSCSKTCGTGTRSRTRSCQNGVVGDPGCEGSSNEAQNCNTNNCASFTAWSSWLSCSKTCGTGTRSRTRSCQHGVVGDPGCEGSSNEAQNCNTHNCASFTAWSSWLSCSKTCGTGTRSRTRSCQHGVVGDPGCEGSSNEAQNCNTNNCASFTAWSSWLSCSKTCGTGTRSRTRSCQHGVVGDPGCEGSSNEAQNCNTNNCASFTAWSSWFRCSKTCGTGTRSRTRSCQHGVVGDPGCEGSSNEAQNCNTNNCASFTAWSSWFSCSKTCGAGTRSRTRSCQNGVVGEPGCVGLTLERSNCNEIACSLQSQLSGWSFWSQCSKTCGTGSRRRTRSCLDGLFGDPGCIGTSFEDENCNSNGCSSFTTWSSWSVCSKSCGTGSRSRTRSCRNGLFPSSECIGPASEIEICNTVSCSLSGLLTEWTGWSDCSKTCGTGLQSRSRTCIGSGVCNAPLGESRLCNTDECPGFSDWTSWSVCSVSCGIGSQSRTRNCINGSFGQIGCIGENADIRECQRNVCGTWNSWESWSLCSKTCDVGTQTRLRICSTGLNSNCAGSNSESQNCLLEDCTTFMWSMWNNWSGCSSTCNGGSRLRKRNCINLTSVNVCQGKSEQMTEACNNQSCTQDGSFDCAFTGATCGWADNRGTKWQNVVSLGEETSPTHTDRLPQHSISTGYLVASPKRYWLDPPYYLDSPVIVPGSTGQYCFSFNYIMTGENVGQLLITLHNIYATSRYDYQVLFWKFMSQGEDWHHYSTSFYINTNSKITIKSNTFPGVNIIAIDDVKLTAGSCK